MIAQPEPIVQVAPLWWDVASTIGSALATIVVAWFAFLQLQRERRQAKQRETAAVAQISASAYTLRRRLKTWLGSNEENDFESWIRAANNAETFGPHLQNGLTNASEMMALLADAPPRVADGVRKAYIYYGEGTRRLLEYATQSRPDSAGLFDWMRLRSDAAKDLSHCVEVLEQDVIEPQLLNTEGILKRTRDQEDPFVQLADALIHDAKVRRLESPRTDLTADDSQ